MDLKYFEDVHPNWELIENLEAAQARATLDLLLMAVYVNDKVTEDEVDVLTEEWKKLPFVGPPDSAEELTDRLHDTHSSLNRIAQNPDLFDSFLDQTVEMIDDEDVQMAVYRLVVIAASADGFDDAELDLCEAVGHKFGLERDTIDDLVRSVWESREKGADAEAGHEHKTPHILGSTASRDRSTRTSPNPFSQKM